MQIPETAREIRNTGRFGRALLVMIALLLCLAPARPVAAADGAGVYWTRAALLKSFFAHSDKVSYWRMEPDAAQRRALTQRLGQAPPARVIVYYGLKAGAVQGLALLDDQMGQHQPISFAVLVGTDGKMKRLEVVAYREPRGHEIRGPRFRAQFRGKTAADKLRLGHEIAAISGATISARAMVIGVRRNLAVLDELVFKPGLASVLAARAAGAK